MKGFWKTGEPFIWLTGGALAFSLIIVAGLVILVMVNGLGFFWPSPIVRVGLTDGRELVGQVTEREKIPQPGGPPGTPPRYRIQLKVGNRDLYGLSLIHI